MAEEGMLEEHIYSVANEHTYDNRDSAYSTPDPTQDGDPLYQDPTELQDEQEKEEIRAELQKTEEEIKTLKQVLASKERAAADLKRRLGITPLKEFKDEASKTWKNVQSSQAYKKTSETLSVAGQKTAQASAAAWQSMSRKLGEMKNSQSFKSFEEKVGSTVSNLKTNAIGKGRRLTWSKVTSPREPKPTFEDVLNSTANADKQDDSQNAPPLPEEKVPL
ncbi:PREDICTED: tumor protein D52-like isoform X24 [Branchiostoma belcheri]|uniref:Tumor protein D52-like isoform X24 n=1 Tax=Branchiostoma belcheri TaxID=7741 RepID=A0A6P4ZXM2_BRABE|nr:PREDICTED: tumor protein D52-like isoform X24 [Branchiostoma belcheri]